MKHSLTLSIIILLSFALFGQPVSGRKPQVILLNSIKFWKNENNMIKVYLANRDSFGEQISVFSPGARVSGNAVTTEYFIKPVSDDSITLFIRFYSNGKFTPLDTQRFPVFERKIFKITVFGLGAGKGDSCQLVTNYKYGFQLQPGGCIPNQRTIRRNQKILSKLDAQNGSGWRDAYKKEFCNCGNEQWVWYESRDYH